MKGLEAEAKERDAILEKRLRTVGNYVHESVPKDNDEVFYSRWTRLRMLTVYVKTNNEVLRKYSPDKAAPNRENCLSHHEVLTRIGGYDPERGQKIVGHRGYCLTGYGLFLNDALANYGKQFLHQKGYTAIQPPYFMFRDHMAKTAQLEQFDEELYKVVESEGRPETDKYLIATSEQPISALHAGEWLQAKELPIKSVKLDMNCIA